jgi:uncharacterized protein YPO0396
MDAIDYLRNARPGYRLAYFEVFNWGTFDSSRGQIYRMEPQGRTALLVGQNGSGKSTLVDALLTLLVQPGVRNYNVAAGSKKRERDERSYIKGACGSASNEEDSGAVTEYLRPNANHFSILLACFRRDDTGQAVSVAQVLYLAKDGTVEKTYAVSNEERTIANDLANLNRTERIGQQLQQRGFRATGKYTEYFGWLSQMLHMRAKALDMFNQTVAVKDIQSLNRFIRDHMLEERPWQEKIDSLLTHFSQLSQAYQSLVRTRRQVEQLMPVEQLGSSIAKLDEQYAQTQATLDATEAFFCYKTVECLTPQIERVTKDVVAARHRVGELQTRMEELDDVQRRLKNEIEGGGGERLREIPRMINAERERLETKQKAEKALIDQLRAVKLSVKLADAKQFALRRQELEALHSQIQQSAKELENQRGPQLLELSRIRTSLKAEQAEIDSLKGRHGNIPPWLFDLRMKIAVALGLTDYDLPFAAELIAVRDEFSDWQSSIEMVLRPLALSLLVPEKHYSRVSQWIEDNRLQDGEGRGQRLVYLRVASRAKSDSKLDQLHPSSLLRRIELREGHPMEAWLRAEISDRFDFRCCETMQEFHSSPRLAVTRQRHTKVGDQRHEKDDRERTSDPRSFILGWNNREKKKQLTSSITELTTREQSVRSQLKLLDDTIATTRQQIACVESALKFREYAEIDWRSHDATIAELQAEARQLVNKNDAGRVLNQRLEEAIQSKAELQQERDNLMAKIGEYESQLADARKILERARLKLADRKSSVSAKKDKQSFAILEESLPKRTLFWDELRQLELDRTKQFHAELLQLNSQRDPLKLELAKLQQRFMNDFPELAVDLQANERYDDNFLGLLESLRTDNLPRLEKRFKERLNEKVIQEIGIFHANLQTEKQDLLSRINALNVSLQQLEYHPGTYMRLEPRTVSDPEIKAFQSSLRECLGEVSNDENDLETRFQRIEKLIQKLRDEERWRDKVTDVRRWFDFGAREVELATGLERSYYEDSAGQSGGEKAKLAFTILVAAIAYQYNIDPLQANQDRFHFVVVDEMFSKVDDRYAEYALQLFEKFGLQLLIVAPLDAKARVTESYVGCYLHTVKDERTKTSEIITMSAAEYEEAMVTSAVRKGKKASIRRVDPPHPGPAKPR